MPNMIQRLILKSMVPGKAMTRDQIENRIKRHTGCRTVLHDMHVHMLAMPELVRREGTSNRWRLKQR